MAVAVAVALLVAWWLLQPPSPNVGDASKLQRTFTAAERQLIESTVVSADELAKRDGKDDRPDWVAVGGVVYDMSASPQWRSGRHHGVQAGTDATKAFVGSAHAVDHLQKMEVVGALAPSR